MRVEPPRMRRDESGPKLALRRYGLPAALAAAGIAWYGADSLRHRREGAFGYELAESVAVESPAFLRAAEALTGAPISHGNEAELLINGDRIFPAFLEAISSAKRTLCLETYVYWRGDIAREVAALICGRARAGVQCKVIVDALGAAKMDSVLVDEMQATGVKVVRFRPPKPYAVRRIANRTHRRLLVADGRVGMTGGSGSQSSGRETRRTPTIGATRTCASAVPWYAGSRAPSSRTGSRPRARCSPATRLLRREL